MTTKVELSIAGRGERDEPLLGDLIEQIQDFFEMVNGVAASVAGNDVERFEWRVVGLSKSSPARVVVEARALPGHKEGPSIAAEARDIATRGLAQLAISEGRPLHFTDNVIDAAERFARRMTRGLAATVVGDPDGGAVVAIRAPEALQVLAHIDHVREAEPVHPYRELGSFEGYIQNVGTDGWGKPYIIVKSRVSGSDIKCYLIEDARKALEDERVADVVWRERRVTAVGILKFRSVGKLSQAEISRLDFADPREHLPQFQDIVNPNFTSGLRSDEYLERLRNGED